MARRRSGPALALALALALHWRWSGAGPVRVRVHQCGWVGWPIGLNRGAPTVDPRVVQHGSAGRVELGVEDVVPGCERNGLLLAVRLSMAAVVMGVAGLAHDGLGILVVSAAYATLAAGAELARRRTGPTAESVPRVLYLLDGAYLGVAVAATGGLGSPVEALFFLHVVTVVLLSDRETGLQVACWDAGILGGVWLFGSAGPGGPPVVALALREAVFLLVALVASGVVALHQQVLETQVRRLTDRDPLTGLANRRGLDHALRRELSRAGREGSPLAVAVLDLDGFKAVNDEQGHQVGDEVLRRVAAALTTSVREYDLPARLGGDEFVVVLPGCAADDAVGVCDRLRRAIAAEVGRVLPLTTSAGVALYGPHGTASEALVGAADAALYQAKRAGRDRTTRAADPDPRWLTDLADA